MNVKNRTAHFFNESLLKTVNLIINENFEQLNLRRGILTLNNTYLFEQVYYFLNMILHMLFSCAELSLLSVIHVPMNTHYYV